MGFDKQKEKLRTSFPRLPFFHICKTEYLERVNGFKKANDFHGVNRIQPNPD